MKERLQQIKMSENIKAFLEKPQDPATHKPLIDAMGILADVIRNEAEAQNREGADDVVEMIEAVFDRINVKQMLRMGERADRILPELEKLSDALMKDCVRGRRPGETYESWEADAQAKGAAATMVANLCSYVDREQPMEAPSCSIS